MSYIRTSQANQTDSDTAARVRLVNVARKNKSIVLTLSASVIGVVAVYTATGRPGLLSGIEPAVIVLGLGLIIAAVRNWEFGLRALLVLVIVEGAIRKWFIPSATETVYFYKDVLMVAILAGYYRKHLKTPFLITRHLRLVYVAVGLFLLYVVTALGLPDGPHPLVGLLGLKAYCLYVPLAFITPRAFPVKERLVGFLKWYLLIVLPVAAIGVMQFLDSNQQSAINRYALGEAQTGQAADIAVFASSSGTSFVRVTGTFSYVTGLSVYLPIMFGLLLAISSLNINRGLAKGVKALYYAALGATVVTAFMTGSRAAVLAMGVAAILYYLLATGRHGFRRIGQFAAVGVIAYFAFSTFFPQAYDAFYNRTFGGEERVNEGWERMVGAVSLPVDEASYAGLLGYGIGLTQNGTPALMRRLGIADQGNPIPIGYEGEPGRVTLELGVLGFALYTLLRLVLLLTVFRFCLSIRDRESKLIAIAAAASLALPLVVGGAVATHTLNVYQWFLVGVVLALYNAERVQLRMQRQSKFSNLEMRTSTVP